MIGSVKIAQKTANLIMFGCPSIHRQLRVQLEGVIMSRSYSCMHSIFLIQVAIITAFPASKLSAQEEDAKEIYFSDSLLSIYTEKENFYAQTENPEDLDTALEFVITELGLDAPLLDFLSGNTVDAMLINADEVHHLGTSLIRGDIYEHIAIRTPETDVQIWVATQGPPLPGKMSISSKWEGGSPRFVVFINWETDPSFPVDSLVFEPPPGAVRIEFDRTSVQ